MTFIHTHVVIVRKIGGALRRTGLMFQFARDESLGGNFVHVGLSINLLLGNEQTLLQQLQLVNIHFCG